jgi:vancomycin permeability regulator SanA
MDKEIIGFLLTICAGLFLLLVMLYTVIWLQSRHYIRSLDEVEPAEYVLVLGAGLEINGAPTDILKDRVEKSVILYKANIVKSLIMSGSNFRGKDEPGAMQSMAIALGVPQSAILVDRQGISTIHSCINLKNRFDPENVIIVTQYFHLPRAIFLQRMLGIQAIGIPADIYKFSLYKKGYWLFREFFALPYNLIKYIIYKIR